MCRLPATLGQEGDHYPFPRSFLVFYLFFESVSPTRAAPYGGPSLTTFLRCSCKRGSLPFTFLSLPFSFGASPISTLILLSRFFLSPVPTLPKGLTFRPFAPVTHLKFNRKLFIILWSSFAFVEVFFSPGSFLSTDSPGTINKPDSRIGVFLSAVDLNTFLYAPRLRCR